MTTERSSEMKTPVSKSQARLLPLLSLPSADCYADAVRSLETAGYVVSGIPANNTWRTAAKLTDAELVSACLFAKEEIEVADYDR